LKDTENRRRKIKIRFIVGNMAFKDEEYFDLLVSKGILKRHDCSPRMREEHDLKNAEKRNHTVYLFHSSMIWDLRKNASVKKKPIPLREGERVLNPWMHGYSGGM